MGSNRSQSPSWGAAPVTGAWCLQSSGGRWAGRGGTGGSRGDLGRSGGLGGLEKPLGDWGFWGALGGFGRLEPLGGAWAGSGAPSSLRSLLWALQRGSKALCAAHGGCLISQGRKVRLKSQHLPGRCAGRALLDPECL